MEQTARPRWSYFVLAVVVVGLGLFTRSETPLLPEFVKLYFGDALWAVMFFLGFAGLFPTASTGRILLLTAVLVFGLEFLQLAKWPWLVQLRQLPLPRFLLGTTFLWSDVIGLAVGCSVAAAGDGLFLRSRDVSGR